MGVAIIQQVITAGGNFDGTLPPGNPGLDKDIKRFPPAATGGLFDFGLQGPHEISSIELHLANQTSWSVVKRDSDGADLILWQGTNETEFVTTANDRILIYEGELLVLTTAGATTAMKSRIAVERKH